MLRHVSLPPDIGAVLAAWSTAPDAASLSPTVLRLARRVPEVREPMAALASTELEQALLGVGPSPDPRGQPDLASSILAAQAAADAGQSVDPVVAAGLERRAEGDLTWWVPAARLHVRASPDRERLARMALSTQDLPYVFPGELHPMQVAMLAGGDRVVQALHVDWLRKLTGFVADALLLDGRALGLWFWPILRFLDDKKLARPLGKLVRARRVPSGARGLWAAYLARIGGDPRKLLAAGDDHDVFVYALAVASERPR